MSVYIPTDPLDNSAGLRGVWAAIDGYEPVRNAFINAMINKFAFTIISSKAWSDPWSFVERGYLEYGETVEEIYVNIANSMSYDPAAAPTRELARTIPDIRGAFHTMNFQKMYPVTVSRAQLNQAFLSYAGVTDLIAAIVNSLYTAMEYDKTLIKKFLLAEQILDNAMPLKAVTGDTTNDTVVAMRTAVNEMSWLNNTYNASGVYNADDFDDLFIITTAANRARFDVDVAAMAFNIDKVDWLGHVMTVDNFNLDVPRLQKILTESNYPFDGNLGLLSIFMDNVKFIIISRDYLQIYTNFREMTSNYVASGLYWNYWLHNWMTFSASPFAQAAAFVAELPELSIVRLYYNNGIVIASSSADVVEPVPARFEIMTEDFPGHFEGNQLIINQGANPTSNTVSVKATAIATGATFTGNITL
jgi:hypothetical protein